MPQVTVLTRVYKAAAGAQFSDAQAALYGPCIEAIAERDGQATPAAVIADARPKKSPMHGYFEWDDKVAGGHYRQQQARHLVSHLQVVVRSNGEEAPQKAFYNIQVESPEPEEPPLRGYVGVEKVSTDEALHAQVLAQALARYRSLRGQYRALKELGPIHRAIDRLAAA